MKVVYTDTNRTECLHEKGQLLVTDLPKDAGGRGDTFSPTDLLALSFASCMLTLMGIASSKLAFDLKGASAEVEKVMVADPHRRIGKLIVRIRVPRLAPLAVREKIEEAALHCPVHHSLHPNVKQEVEFVWGT